MFSPRTEAVLQDKHSFRRFSLPHPSRGRSLLLAFALFLCGWLSLEIFFGDQPVEGYLMPKQSLSFSTVVVGVLTTQEFFDSRLAFQLSTFLSDIFEKEGNVIISVERGVVPVQRFAQRVKISNFSGSDSLFVFESKCSVGYSQLLCRSIELLKTMTKAHPAASWYIRIDDDTLLLPQALHGLLSQLNPRDSLALGSPSFYFCTSFQNCAHRRYPGLRWNEIDQVVSLIRGGAGYILSRSVITWIISNIDQISATAQELKSSAEDLIIFYALRKHMRSFEIIQASSFLFERPEVALRSSPFNQKPNRVTSVSFHMNHNLVNGYSLYKELSELSATVRDFTLVDSSAALKRDDVSSNKFAKIRSLVALKMMTCQHATEFKTNVRDWDSNLRSGLIDMVLVQMMMSFDKARDHGSSLETFYEEAVATGKLCQPAMKDKNEQDALTQPKIFSTRLPLIFQSEESGENYAPRERDVAKRRTNRMLQVGGEDHARLVRSTFSSTIDLLVDCEDTNKGVRHKIDTHRQRKKSLWEWNALQAVHGYARSKISGDGYFWQMRYLHYISHLRDSWESHKDGCMRTSDCQGEYGGAEILDLVFYLRRGRVVLTERKEHHLALGVLEIPHVYIHDEGDVKSIAHSLCFGDLPFVKCVSNLSQATESLVELLLGKAFFNRTSRYLY